jgi:uncharacterized membrane protein
MSVAALGALAAAAADTWATEVGTLYGGTPRSLINWKAVSAGTSGGVSVAGSVARVAGAAFVASIATLLSLPRALVVVTIAGVAGAVADSLLGATVQERRWCAACGRHSERHVHDCGTPTSLAGGQTWMDNDLVNLLATFVGAAVAAALAVI